MKLENLCVKYGENVIFEGFNFDIKDGEKIRAASD